MKQNETKKTAKKARTGNSRTTLWRKKKKREDETRKAQEKVLLKKEKTTELVALGLTQEQSKAVSEVVVETENETIEKLIKEALISKLKARKVLDEMIINGDVVPEGAVPWSYARKAIE